MTERKITFIPPSPRCPPSPPHRLLNFSPLPPEYISWVPARDTNKVPGCTCLSRPINRLVGKSRTGSQESLGTDEEFLHSLTHSRHTSAVAKTSTSSLTAAMYEQGSHRHYKRTEIVFRSGGGGDKGGGRKNRLLECQFLQDFIYLLTYLTTNHRHLQCQVEGYFSDNPRT